MNAPTPMPTPVMTGLTWQEFLDLPDTYHYPSLIDGDLYVTAASFLHQLVLSRLFYAIIDWTNGAQRRGIATSEPGVPITHNRGYLPDIAWWRHDKLAPPGGRPDVTGMPDLVAEVLSPSTKWIDATRKRADYPTVGIGELWLVDPNGPSASIIRYESGVETVIELDADGTLTSPQLPGFAITLRDLTAW